LALLFYLFVQALERLPDFRFQVFDDLVELLDRDIAFEAGTQPIGLVYEGLQAGQFLLDMRNLCLKGRDGVLQMPGLPFRLLNSYDRSIGAAAPDTRHEPPCTSVVFLVVVPPGVNPPDYPDHNETQTTEHEERHRQFRSPRPFVLGLHNRS